MEVSLAWRRAGKGVIYVSYQAMPTSMKLRVQRRRPGSSGGGGGVDIFGVICVGRAGGFGMR